LKVIWFLFLAVFWVVFSSNAAAKNIVVTIPPLASAIKPLLSPDDKVFVLLGKNQSPHHFSLKPSHLFTLAKADLIISVGLGLDEWANKAIASSDADKIVFSKLVGINFLEGYGHSHNHAHHHHVDYDPHIWLDIDNIKVLATAVAKKISAEHKITNWLQQLTEADKNIASQLAGVKNKPFLVQHAGFQYFERRYQLDNKGAIQTNDSGTSLRKILSLRKKISQHSINCIFTSSHGSKKQVSSLVKSSADKINTVELNALGDKNKNTVLIMQSLTKDYLACLGNK